LILFDFLKELYLNLIQC